MSFSPNKVERSINQPTTLGQLSMKHSKSEAGNNFMTLKTQTTKLQQLQLNLNAVNSHLPKIK